MNKEQLMLPRWKVISDYPGSPYVIGVIKNWLTSINMDDYPHIFKRLEWWEETAIKDMPEYIKYPSERIVKAKWEWNQQEQCYLAQSGYSNSVIEPATIEEYDNYINSKK